MKRVNFRVDVCYFSNVSHDYCMFLYESMLFLNVLHVFMLYFLEKNVDLLFIEIIMFLDILCKFLCIFMSIYVICSKILVNVYKFFKVSHGFCLILEFS